MADIWEPIDGATSATFTKTLATIDDATKYRCEVTSSVDAVTTDEVMVDHTPHVVIQPDPVSINEGEDLRMAVYAVGTGTLTYQWRFKPSP